ncbi:MAG: hypothetical protein LBF74_01990, partial [Treponema sp.]|nr:hypothetical protein [Treponema sp.]
EDREGAQQCAEEPGIQSGTQCGNEVSNGHGKNHAGEIYAVLNLLGFLLHALMLLLEEEYQKTWGSFGRRETFFEGLRFSFRRFLHESWEAFLMFVLGDDPGGQRSIAKGEQRFSG